MDRWFLIALGVISILIVYTSPVRKAHYYDQSDPGGTLLTAQSILQNGSISLDSYGSVNAMSTYYRYRIFTRHGHLYYYFPIGTPLLSVPFVAVARLAGLDMTETDDDARLQAWLIALTLTLITILTYCLCRTRLRESVSFLLTLIFIFGTSIASSCGTALWNFNFELVFMLLASNLLFLILQADGRQRRWPSVLLGVTLFMAYLCRPSAAIFVLGVIIVLLLRRRMRDAGLTVLVLVLLSGFFIAFNMYVFCSALPPYYDLGRLSGMRDRNGILVAFTGLLLSPSRGIMVFSPFVIPVWLTGWFFLRRDSSLLLFAYGWSILQTISLSRFYHWWGGHCFGPRLMTDLVPALLLIAILTLARLKGWRRGVYLTLLILTGTASIAINTGQGLFNPSTIRWNYYPDIDTHQDNLFDFRCPQFLATPERLEERMLRQGQRHGQGQR